MWVKDGCVEALCVFSHARKPKPLLSRQWKEVMNVKTSCLFTGQNTADFVPSLEKGNYMDWSCSVKCSKLYRCHRDPGRCRCSPAAVAESRVAEVEAKVWFMLRCQPPAGGMMHRFAEAMQAGGRTAFSSGTLGACWESNLRPHDGGSRTQLKSSRKFRNVNLDQLFCQARPMQSALLRG